MQDGRSSHVIDNRDTHGGHQTNVSHLLSNGNPAIQNESPSKDHDPSSHQLNGDGEPTTPRSRKRKHSETHSAQRERKSFRPSPPWKKVEADGVTSFVEDGKRKSSRTNAVPLELRPPSEKRQTRGAYNRYHDEKVSSMEETQERRGLASPSLSRKQDSKDIVPPRHRESTAMNATSIAPTKRAYRRRSVQPTTNGFHHVSPVDRHQGAADEQHRPKRGRKPTIKGEKRVQHDVKPYFQSVATNGDNQSAPSQEAPKFPRIRIRLGPRVLPVLNPQCLPPRQKHGSLHAFLEQDDPLEGQEYQRASREEIQKEARTIARLIRAGKPDGKLSGVSAVESDDDVPKEHFSGYTHPDYLNKHLADLQSRLFREGREHRATAKRLALAAQAAVKARIPKTAEEIEDDLRLGYLNHMRHSVLREFHAIMEHLSSRIREKRRVEFEAQEAAAGREKMRKMVDRSEGLLTARTGRRSLDVTMGSPSESDADVEGSDASAVTDASSEDSDNDDSEESSASSDEDGDVDEDKDLTAEQLREKYARLPSLPPEELDDDEQSLPGTNGSASPAAASVSPNQIVGSDQMRYELEEVDDVLMDDDEESDSDDGTDMSDEESGEEEGSDGSMSEEEQDHSLLGFLSKQDIEAAANDQALEGDSALPDDTEPNSADTRIREAKLELTSTGLADPVPEDVGDPELNVIDVPEPASDDASRHSTPGTSVTTKPSREESMSSIEPVSGDLLAMQHRLTQNEDDPKTPIPSLLRGQLRPYQHAGLDWLARMYAEDTNGILADEMGLGKTFQTIALLAHLATHHRVWGPHLVVVPTSVMLNWEMEFKKFCPGFKILTYYGTQEERRAKRKGWFDNDRWHVCITSYQLALQDAIPLKRRGWHYLILDEAHNIKNFRSQRWQTLLSFRSQARLLLTGTPLQNNLSELWSLLFFLAPEQDEDGTAGFGSLQEFSKVFHQPVDQILEHGRGALDEESMNIVNKLHKVLRPHLLRRMKADVEKQMPKKYEHITVCRLSKRQRQLYDSYMGLSGTRDSFASGNYMSIINCLMQLRKVCNHPDLFETRQIVTSFAMPKSAVVDFEINELLVRRRLGQGTSHTHSNAVVNLWSSNALAAAALRRQMLSAVHELDAIIHTAKQNAGCSATSHESVESALGELDSKLRRSNIEALETQRALTSQRLNRRPALSEGLIKFLTLESFSKRPVGSSQQTALDNLSRSSTLQEMTLDLQQRSEVLGPAIRKFGCVTPAVVAPSMSRLALTDNGVQAFRTNVDQSAPDPFHEPRMRLSIAFPDKSLIQYDCGKLQQLDKLLRRLQSGGHRALIFTQMTKVLDILEQFMNLHGHRYLRLDGATKIEQRQVLTERFNTDPRILAFILSSRSGGLGINLTGADTVIFYDLDWNPAMDKQCQDRCHRIGQTRDVHIYRFVSEGTIEANILRKSNQKRMLDDVVIQEGDFTTEYLNKLEFEDGNDETNAALDKVLGGGGGSQGRVLQQAEDREDQEAAKVALKEDVQTDAADFEEQRPSTAVSATTPRTAGLQSAGSQDASTPIIPGMPSAPAIAANAQEDTQNLKSATSDAPIDASPSTKEQLYEAFASKPLPQDKPVLQYKRDADGALLLDEQGNPAEQCGFDDYLLRLMEWEMRDYSYAPLSDEKRRKKAKKGREVWDRSKR